MTNNAIDPERLSGNRKSVWDRDGGRCRYCGTAATTIDHVEPRSRGGDNTAGNLVACCQTCNAFKADRWPDECNMRLLKPGTVNNSREASRVRQTYISRKVS